MGQSSFGYAQDCIFICSYMCMWLLIEFGIKIQRVSLIHDHEVTEQFKIIKIWYHVQDVQSAMMTYQMILKLLLFS